MYKEWTEYLNDKFAYSVRRQIRAHFKFNKLKFKMCTINHSMNEHNSGFRTLTLLQYDIFHIYYS